MTGEISSLTEQMVDVLAPLNADTEQRAVDLAIEAIGCDRDTARVHGAELAVSKPERRGGRPARLVRVLLAEGGSSSVHEILIDDEGGVVSDRDLGPRNMPYLEDELRQARDIAERDDRVARLVDGSDCGIGAFAPSSDDSGHRMVGLHFLDVADGAIPKPLTSVIVDLAIEEVVSVRVAEDRESEREES